MALALLDSNTRITVTDAQLPGIDGGDPDTVYTIRQILPSESKAIAKRHTRPRPTGERIDQDGLIEDLLDLALVGWEGVFLSGEPAPCTRDHKLLLDGARRVAILQVAGLNRTDLAAKDHSFRPPA